MATQSKAQRVYDIVWQSLKGEPHDYTQGSIPKAVFLLAIPMILELSLESVFAVVDIFFVSKLGPGAIATVGLTESVITIVYSVAIGLSTAATAIVARRIGEKNPEDAAHAGAQSLIVALIVTVIASISGVVFAADILSFMGASDEVVREGAVFTRIMFGGSLAIILLFLINGIFRGAGDAAMAMKSLWLASLINIILCPILIHFYGLKGAAIATVIGRSTGVLYQCYHLFKGSGILKFHSYHFRFDGKIIRSIINVGWPATFQFIIASGSWIVLARLVAETGGTTASGRLPDRYPQRGIFHFACLGIEQCSSNACRAESRRKSTATSRTKCDAHSKIQCNIYEPGDAAVPLLCSTDHPHLYS
jgi:Na+-driven multidrug efflux pump